MSRETGGYRPPSEKGKEGGSAALSEAQKELAQRKAELRRFAEDGRLTPEDRQMLDRPIFEGGQMVRVMRKGSGAIEDGWIASGLLNPDGRVLVSKSGRAGKIIQKLVKEEDLVSWNS